MSDALPSLAAACTRAVYEVVIDGEDLTAETVQHALDEVIEGGEIEVARKRKNKVFDLKRSLPKEPRVRSLGHEIVIDVTTRMGQEGSLRPEQLIGEAFSRSGLDGTVRRITRTDTLIEEEGGVRRPL